MDKEKTDHKWFEELYASYSRELFWIAMAFSNNKLLAEDAVQEAFLYVWRNRKTLKSEKSLKPYLITTIRNYIIDFFRHRQVEEKHHSIILAESLAHEEFGNEDTFEEKLRLALELINSLPEGCRKVFVMTVMEGLSYEQVAKQLNISKNTVKMQVKIAYRKILSKRLTLSFLIYVMLKLQFFTPLF